MNNVGIIGGRPSYMSALVALMAMRELYKGEVVAVHVSAEESKESIEKKFLEALQEQEHNNKKMLESAAVEFKKLGEMCKSSDMWLEPPKKKFRGRDGYLNGQNLPFYHRFS